MTAALAIRRARLEDADAIVGFQQQMALETEDRVLTDGIVQAGVRHLLQDPRDGFYLLACTGERIVASLMVTTEWSDWRNGLYWWIQSVYVVPTHRRRGIYRGLYTEVKALAEADPRICGFRLYVERSNEVARRTYEALGMQPTPYRLYEETTPSSAADTTSS